MFTTLVESRAVRPRRTAGTLASIALHGSLLAAVVAVAAPKPGNATVAPPEERIRRFEIAPPPARGTPRVQAALAAAPAPALSQTIVVPPTLVPTSIVDIEVRTPAIPGDNIGIRPLGSTSDAPGNGTPNPGVNASGVIDANVADRAPVLTGTPQAPLYPSALRASGVTGRVTARFVIDTTGRVELDGVEFVDASHPLFSDAARSALARYRFTAGEFAGRKVRTLVMMPFVFSLK